MTLYEPQDVAHTLESIKQPLTVVMLDPWYNKGIGGVRDDYDEWLSGVIALSGKIADHVYVWGFPEIVWRQLNLLTPDLTLVTWLTWYYKNCPSVIRGWRSAQYACLHLSRPGAKLYPEHFLNDAQKQKQAEGKLRYMPGPTSVIEAPLNIGFVGKHEQTGHPSQKPISVITSLLEMTTKPGDTVLDPMCGSGTTGIAACRIDRKAILCDSSPEYMEITRRRIAAEMNGGPYPFPKKSRKNSSASLFSESDAD